MASSSKDLDLSEKLPGLTWALVALLVLGLLALGLTVRPARASEPTPTPGLLEAAGSTEEGFNPLCELTLDLSRDSLNPPGVAVNSAAPAVFFVNPAVNAGDVPVHTWVSAAFDKDIDGSTINGNTVYLSRGNDRVAGTVTFIAASNMAVFKPDTYLSPGTTYTVTISSGVRSLAGEPLSQETRWSFTTVSGLAAAGGEVGVAGVSPYGDGMVVYFGDLHSHTGYSDGYHSSIPADAFASARASGMDFFATTDHDIMLTETEWQNTLAQANQATVEGQFIALRAFEFSHPKGHLNIFNTNTFVRGDNPAYTDLQSFYGWLTTQAEVVAQFNHPLKESGLDQNFNNFLYNGFADHKIKVRELTNRTQFLLGLNKGWHDGTLKNSDTHSNDWGCCRLMGLVAPSLTRANILAALRAKRTFFVSPFDRNMAVLMKANGYWMGSAIPATSKINFHVKVSDPGPGGSYLRLKLYDNGKEVAATTLSAGTLYTWQPTVQATLGHYYYVEAYYEGWTVAAYSSPIWVERAPAAEAGASQTVMGGDLVTLNGSQSWDPDGRPLAYRWVRQSGPAAALNGADTARPTFVAPNTAGDMIFKLTVEDVGGLIGADTTVVTVRAPVLSISKSGPDKAEPGEQIIYTLTVVNSGPMAATDLVITDALPAGVAYVSGGALLANNRVRWTLPRLAANGGTAQVSFTVTAGEGALVNNDYRVTSAEGASAVGRVTVITNGIKTYMPVITKGF